MPHIYANGTSGVKPGPKPLAATHPLPESQLLTSEQVASLLNISVGHLANDRYAARQQGCEPRIPYVMIGRSPRYRREIIERIAREGV